MKQLCNDVRLVVEEAYDRAKKIHGDKHNSAHEAYAVIKEEFCEAIEEVNEAGMLIEERFWDAVRNNKTAISCEVAKDIYEKSVLAACEMIQTAAMAYKALQGYGRKGEENEQSN